MQEWDMVMKDVELGEWYRISICFGNSTVEKLEHIRRSAGWGDTQERKNLTIRILW